MPSTLSAFADEAADKCADQIAALRQAGLLYIDLRTIDGFNISALPVDHAKSVRDQLDAAGILCAMFGSPIGKIDAADDLRADLARLDHMAALAPILNCRNVRIFSFYNRKASLPRMAFQKEAIQRLRQLKARAQDLGLVLYHENESDIFGDHAEDVLTIARELHDPAPPPKGAFKMIFDFGNFNAARENVWENWVALRAFTDAFHLKDNRWTFDGKLSHTPVGDGDGKVGEILADAVEHGFNGPFSVEPHLRHSGASGEGNRAFSSLTPRDSFQIACKAAVRMLTTARVALDNPS